MKRYYTIVFIVLMHFQAMCQLNPGGLHALFGVDADTRGGYLKYGPATGTITSDDWFISPGASGNGVIDTSNAAYYRSQLQAGNNISFSKRMSAPLYSNISGKIWLDALYTRDYIAQSSSDSTIFAAGGKNGDDPANWHGTVGSIPDKTDLVDVYGHMRRNGNNVHDSLWFFTGASTIGTSGSRYFDIELYKNHVTYNNTTNAFSTGGANAGHTQWLFDASGNIIQTGDLIVAVSYSPGSITVEVRIWISKTTYTTVIPNLFSFGSSFDGSTPAFGYASIVSKTGATAFGSGIGNYSATPAADTTYSTPWSSQYSSLQFIEVGLNLTRIGIDPALYASVLNSGACQSAFASIFFKSRSSTSFTSNLQDFAGPFDFLQTPVLDYGMSVPALSCYTPTGSINVINNTTAGYYSWTTTDGNISATNNNSVTVNKGGSYILTAAVAQGCPVVRTDTIKVTADTFPPIASFYITSTADLAHLVLHGGNTAASNYNTPFGGSQGLLWNWSGPRGFTSTIQNPVTDTVFGNYQLVVTEKRNGCTAIANNYVNFTILASATVQLRAEQRNGSIALKWNASDIGHAVSFELERSDNGGAFTTIGIIPVKQVNNGTTFSFSDIDAMTGARIYRVKMVTIDGQFFYSNTVSFNAGSGISPYYVARNNFSGTVQLIANAALAGNATVVVYNTAGAIIYSQNISLQKGINAIDLQVSEIEKNKLHIVALYSNNRRCFTEKAIF